jgi:putative ABC transport system substrate-binding protein
MQRREFVRLLGGAAVAWPLTARAQQSKIVNLGFVTWLAPAMRMRLDDLHEGLRAFGYVEGKNLKVESYFTDGNRQYTQEVIRALVDKPVDVLVVWQTPAAQIAKETTRTIPIVMLVSDPLATGLVPSLARPGGNLTGVSNSGPDLAGKRLELLREIKPSVRTVAFLGSSMDPNGPTFARETKAAADKIGLNLVTRLIDGPAAIDEALFAAMKRDMVEAVVIQPVFTGQRDKIVDLAKKSGLPVISDFPPFAEAGALFSFGVDDAAQLRRTAYYVDRILKGAKPADLPIEQPTKFQLVINAITANALGWPIPPILLARADKVIE